MKKILSVILAVASLLTCFSLTVFADEEESFQTQETVNYGVGTENYDVYEIQYILKQFGYFVGDVTGYLGEKTAASVKTFQQDSGLDATGIVNEDTLAAVRAAGCVDASVNIKSQLYIKESIDSSDAPVDSITRTQQVYIYSEKDGWYHVETESGMQGFVSKKYLSAGALHGINAKIVDVSESLNLRAKEDNNAAVVAKIPADAAVTVIGGNGDWFKIRYEDKEGYAFKKYVSIGGSKGAATTVSELFDAWTGSITASSLKVRSGPSTGYDVVNTLSKGTTVSVIGESGDWYYVQLKNSSKGYVSKKYIQKGSGYSTCTVNVDSSLKIRSGQGKNYNVVTSVKNGTVLTLLDDSSSWYKVKTSDGKTGYVDGQYVKLGGSVAKVSSAASSSVSKPSGTYKKGSDGSGVVAIQKRLKELGFFTGTSTGYYGTATVAAVKTFQSKNGLSADGVCGTNTMNKLFSTSAVSNSSKGTNNSTPSSSNTNTNTTGGNSGSSKGQQIVEYAKQFLGRPYSLGANGPNKFDCSGFTRYVYRNCAGITLPRTAYEQGYRGPGTKVTAIGDLKVGDLVFFNTVSDNDLCDHAGIYIGNNQFIHAASGSTMRVTISSFSTNYYKTRFSWGRHVI